MKFVASVKQRHPSFFQETTVLEVGSLNINGSVRGLFEQADYTGIDLGPGPGVDLVAHAADYHHRKHFHVIVSTEALEHDRRWRDSLASMLRNLRPGGLMIVTCAGPRRQEHGTLRTTPADSPFTTDYYGNLTVEQIEQALPRGEFSEYSLEYARGMCDVLFFGIKKTG